MDKFERIKYWLDISDYDLQTAKSMLQSKRWLYVVFMCQQALEKLIKALYIYEFDTEPPRTHNLTFLFKELSITQNSDCLNGEQDLMDFLDMLSAHYLNARYPDYKTNLAKKLSKEKAQKCFKRTEEIYKCLKSLIR